MSSSSHPLVSMLAACDENCKLSELQIVSEVIHQAENRDKNAGEFTNNKLDVEVELNDNYDDEHNNNDVTTINDSKEPNSNSSLDKDYMNVEEISNKNEHEKDIKGLEFNHSHAELSDTCCYKGENHHEYWLEEDNFKDEEVKNRPSRKKRMSSPERIRQHAMRLTREIHELSSRHSVRNARHFTRSSSVMQRRNTQNLSSNNNNVNIKVKDESNSEDDDDDDDNNGTDNITSYKMENHSKSNVSKTTKNNGLKKYKAKKFSENQLRLPDLNKCFEESRDRHLRAAQENKVVFPPIKQSIAFSEKNPDAFSLRFQSKDNDLHSPIRLIKNKSE